MFLSPKFLAEACALLVPARVLHTITISDFSIFLPADLYLPAGNTADEGGVHQRWEHLLVRQAYRFLPVIVAHVHPSLQQEYQDLLFPGKLWWLEQGIYNNFLLMNTQKAWEHTCTRVQALVSSFTSVFMDFYILTAKNPFLVASLVRLEYNYDVTRFPNKLQYSWIWGEQTKQVMLVPLLKCVTDTKICSVKKYLVC